MAMAAMLISTVAGLAGSFMQAGALNAQAKAQQQIAEFNARQQEVQAAREQAAGIVRGELEMREGKRLASKARAGFAQRGVDTTQGSPLLLDAEIMKEATFRQNTAILDAQNRERTLNEEAKGSRYEGAVRAASSRAQARASILSGIGSAFSGIANFKFG